METLMEKALRPIYQALDRNQFSKALKLTQEKPQSEWPITVALKIHCLHRSGNSLDACRELRGMLGVLCDNWDELDERTWLLGLGTQEPSDSVSNSTQNPSKSKNKKKHGSQSNKMNAKDATSSSTSSENIDNHLDFVHVLDLSLSERQERVQRQVPPFLFMNIQDILDEVRFRFILQSFENFQ
jgi:hypothetical protein